MYRTGFKYLFSKLSKIWNFLKYIYILIRTKNVCYLGLSWISIYYMYIFFLGKTFRDAHVRV